MIRPKALVIGGSSPAASMFVNSLRYKYDLEIFSSSPIRNTVRHNYDDPLTVLGKKFEKILIFSSGVPARYKYKSEFDLINNKIFSILDNLDLESCEITFMSSFSVFDKKINVIDQTTDYSPSDYYGESKVEIEMHLLQNYVSVLMKLNILRLPVYIYPGVRNNFMGAALNKIYTGESIQLSNPMLKFQIF